MEGNFMEKVTLTAKKACQMLLWQMNYIKAAFIEVY
jgi:hypothetical protein